MGGVIRSVDAARVIPFVVVSLGCSTRFAGNPTTFGGQGGSQPVQDRLKSAYGTNKLRSGSEGQPWRREGRKMRGKFWYLSILLALMLGVFFIPAGGVTASGATGTFCDTFYATDSDGWLRGSHQNYATAHNKDVADYRDDGGDDVFVGQLLYYGYNIYRAGLFFNTSSLPNNADIIDATLSLYGTADVSITNFYVTVVKGADLDDPLVSADYGDLLDETESRGRIYTSQWTVGGYNDIQLNLKGRLEISQTGITKFGLRSSRDIDAVAPGAEFVSLSSSEGTAPAKLTVTYEVDDDSPPPEVGVEWVNDYPGDGDDRTHGDDSANGLVYQLQHYSDWDEDFNFGDEGAWEEDFKAVSQGGTDYLYVDDVDLVMFVGHGDPSKLHFADDTHDDEYLEYTEALWGDKDLEWMFLQSCKTLEDDDASPPYKSSGHFAQALNRAHLICGAEDEMHDRDLGTYIGAYLTCSYSVLESWFYGCDYGGESSCTLRIISETSYHFWEQVWREGTVFSDPTPDNYYYCYDYECS